MTTYQVLEQVAALYRQPGTWTQRATARDRNGLACCWCLAGAVLRAGEWRDERTDAATAALGFASRREMTTWNDMPRTQTQVLARVEAALETLA